MRRSSHLAPAQPTTCIASVFLLRAAQGRSKQQGVMHVWVPRDQTQLGERGEPGPGFSHRAAHGSLLQ